MKGMVRGRGEGESVNTVGEKGLKLSEHVVEDVEEDGESGGDVARVGWSLSEIRSSIRA